MKKYHFLYRDANADNNIETAHLSKGMNVEAVSARDALIQFYKAQDGEVIFLGMFDLEELQSLKHLAIR